MGVTTNASGTKAHGKNDQHNKLATDAQALRVHEGAQTSVDALADANFTCHGVRRQLESRGHYSLCHPP